MADKPTLLASTALTPLENKQRKVVILPGTQSTDFIVTQRCAILKVGGRLTISASDLPGDPGGSYTWSTTSNKIKLLTNEGPTVTVEALDQPGSGRESEEIVVTRQGRDGTTKKKSIALTVAKVMFKRSANQRYGYDDSDSPLDRNDDHLSIERNKSTFVQVDILGGAVGSDFEFACDDPSVCEAIAPPNTATFELEIKGKAVHKKDTLLRAKVKCLGNAEFAKIHVHVYAERLIKVLISKIEDTRSPGTRLRFRDADYASHQDTANRHVKDAVVRFELRNHKADNSVTDIAFDPDNSGALIYDIAEGGGAGVDAIANALPATDDTLRVVVLAKMKSLYYLERAARAGDRKIYVDSEYVLPARMDLGQTNNVERIKVVRSDGNEAVLEAPLRLSHARGAPLQFHAGGWGDTDPLLVVEDETVLKTQWIIIHEVLHKALELKDLDDPSNLMHYTYGNGEYRLRYMPRQLRYKNSKESQWDKIVRDTPISK